MGGKGDIALMGALVIGCLVVAFMTGYAGLLVVGVRLNRMTVDTFFKYNAFLLGTGAAWKNKEKNYQVKSVVHVLRISRCLCLICCMSCRVYHTVR